MEKQDVNEPLNPNASIDEEEKESVEDKMAGIDSEQLPAPTQPNIKKKEETTSKDAPA